MAKHSPSADSLSQPIARVTISGTPISLNPSGALVIGTTTLPLVPSKASVITINGKSYTIQHDGQLVIDGATLSISKTPISGAIDVLAGETATTSVSTTSRAVASTTKSSKSAASSIVDSLRTVVSPPDSSDSAVGRHGALWRGFGQRVYIVDAAEIRASLHERQQMWQ